MVKTLTLDTCLFINAASCNNILKQFLNYRAVLQLSHYNRTMTNICPQGCSCSIWHDISCTCADSIAQGCSCSIWHDISCADSIAQGCSTSRPLSWSIGQLGFGSGDVPAGFPKTPFWMLESMIWPPKSMFVCCLFLYFVFLFRVGAK